MKQAHYDDELLTEIEMFSWQQGYFILTTPIVDSHTLFVKGWRNAKLLMGGSPGFCMMRLKLKSMNGLLKSMSSSLEAVIVIGASAMSLF